MQLFDKNINFNTLILKVYSPNDTLIFTRVIGYSLSYFDILSLDNTYSMTLNKDQLNKIGLPIENNIYESYNLYYTPLSNVKIYRYGNYLSDNINTIKNKVENDIDYFKVAGFISIFCLTYFLMK